ncbi:MAG: hypothetical protein E6Q97_37665 [Desulfurellales bacterium]|nr:MAG: hypothetical protein E6Q97_37665 [Desulfurellales bacterium]
MRVKKARGQMSKSNKRKKRGQHLTAAEEKLKRSLRDGQATWAAEFRDGQWYVRPDGPPIPESALASIVFIPDCHHPYVDQAAWQLALDVVRKTKPEIIVVLGDFIDNLPVNNHGLDSPLKYSLLSELSAARHALVELEQAAGPQLRRKIFVEGNHETRLNRYIMQRAPELHGLVNIETALGLKEAGWEFYPYKTTCKLGKLHITHDTGKAGKNAHRSTALAYMGSAVQGHTHRMAYEVTGTFDGTPYLAAMLGWLGDRKAADYMHEVGAAEWVHGMGIGHMERDTGIVHVQPIPFVNGKCVVNGELLSLP